MMKEKNTYQVALTLLVFQRFRAEEDVICVPELWLFTLYKYESFNPT